MAELTPRGKVLRRRLRWLIWCALPVIFVGAGLILAGANQAGALVMLFGQVGVMLGLLWGAEMARELL